MKILYSFVRVIFSLSLFAALFGVFYSIVELTGMGAIFLFLINVSMAVLSILILKTWGVEE